MNSLILPLVLTFLFYLALASPPDLRAAPGPPCAHICAAATRDDTVFCERRDSRGTGLQECLTCLQEGGYADDGNQDSLANYLAALDAACSETSRRDSHQKPAFSSSIHRRATANPSLSKGAIAGIAVGAILALILAASLVYFLYQRRIRGGSGRTSVRSWKGPRRTTSSLDFKCRTRVTPMASRVDFRRLHIADTGAAGSEKRRSGVQPGDALGSNPVLAKTLEGNTPPGSPHAGTESSWNGQTLCSASQSPPYTGSIKWASPSIPSPRTPAPAYSPHRTSPHTLPSATPSSTRSAAPLLPGKTIYTPPKYGSVSPPSSYRSAESGYGVLYPPGEIWEGPTRALRTQRGTWDLRSLEEGRGGSVTPSAIAEVGGGSAWGYARATVPRSGEHHDI